MTRPCAPACEPDDNGHCQLAEDITKLTGKTMLDSILATSPPEPRARGVVPPTPTPEGAQRSILGLSAAIQPEDTDPCRPLTLLATEAPRGGYIPPPGYGLPVSMPFPDSIDDEGLPQ